MKIISIGSGFSALDVKVQKEEHVLVLQQAFPYCIEHINITPDYWVCGDPHGYMDGFKYLLETSDKNLDSMTTLVPSFFTGSFELYRQYCGNTPLGRIENGWSDFQTLLSEVTKKHKVNTFPATSTKYIKINGDTQWSRFAGDKVIFGSVEFDGERISGDHYKWALENKLTAVVLPVCHYLGASQVRIAGFDYAGPRFYSNDARHPWDCELQSNNKDKVLNVSLSILQEWAKAESVHGMKIFSATNDKKSLPNEFLEYLGEL